MDEEKKVSIDEVCNYLFETFCDCENRDGYKTISTYFRTVEELVDDFRKTFSGK